MLRAISRAVLGAILLSGATHAAAQTHQSPEIVREGVSPAEGVRHRETPLDAQGAVPDRNHPQVQALYEELRRVNAEDAPEADGRERPQATVAGYSATIITPTWDYPRLKSYVRFYNQRTTATTIGMFIMGSPTAKIYGKNVFVTVPPRASIQLAYSEIMSRAGLTSESMFGRDYYWSIYMTTNQPLQSYQHVVHSAYTGFFENMTTCQWDEIGTEGLLEASLINVHTTSSYMTEYPSQVSFHHYGTAEARYRASIYNSTSGALVDAFTFNMLPAETLLLSAEWYQDSWVPRAVDSHMNIVFRRDDGGTFQGIPAHYIRNERVDGFLNMTQHCRIGYDP